MPQRCPPRARKPQDPSFPRERDCDDQFELPCDSPCTAPVARGSWHCCYAPQLLEKQFDIRRVVIEPQADPQHVAAAIDRYLRLGEPAVPVLRFGRTQREEARMRPRAQRI